MSRESARCRERERVRDLEATLGSGCIVELMGVRLIVLFAEQRRAAFADGTSRTAANAPALLPARSE